MKRLAVRESIRCSYVGARDFCAIFEREMNRLYSLALLLTAEHQTAEQCFIGAFYDCVHGADVFPGWEQSWSRRAIVKQAIRLVRPRPDDSDIAVHPGLLVDTPDVSDRLLQLRPFDRFVFAMTVLERFTVRESAALMNCVPTDVEKARMRVLQFIAADAQTPTGELLSRSAAGTNVSATA